MLERKNQMGGDGSINIQSDKDVNLNVGITYSEARQIALDIFEANFVKLSKNAAELAYLRTQEFTDKYLKKIFEVAPYLIESMEDPDMQYALFTAQKEYARTGDENLGDLLVDILVDRASQKERSILQIVNNEALTIAPKLTSEQYNVLTLIFLFRYTRRNNLKNFDDFISYIKISIQPFIKNIRTDSPCYQHLEYTGCGTLVPFGTLKIEDQLKSNYPGLFWRGAEKDEINDWEMRGLIFPDLVIPCIHDENKYQFNALNNDVLRDKCKMADLSDQQISDLLGIQSGHLMSNNEIQSKLGEKLPEFLDFVKIWDESLISSFTLTSVGIAIGYANLRRMTKEQYDISKWIK